MEHRKQAAQAENIEHRAFSAGMEVRKADTGKATLRGYAARFGSIYDMGWFTEEVSPDAFKNADLTDVRILFNHDSNQILGRTKSGTARVGVDKEGLWYEVDLPESATALLEAVQRGDIDQSSWGFSLRKDSWTKLDGQDKQHRILEQVDTVYDASPVTFPANPDTSVAKRSFEILSEAEKNEQRQAVEAETQNTEIIIELALLERRFHQNTLK